MIIVLVLGLVVRLNPSRTFIQFIKSNQDYILQQLLVLSYRAQISETTDNLNRLEGDLTSVQDSNSEASKELSALEREARELNVTSGQLHHQLDILKNSNFLGEKGERMDFSFLNVYTLSLNVTCSYSYHTMCTIPVLWKWKLLFWLFYKGAYDSIRSFYNKSRDAERRANESTTTKPSTVRQSADTRRRTERLIATKKDDFNRKNAANKRALGDLSAKAQGLDMKKINEKVWSYSIFFATSVNVIKFNYLCSICISVQCIKYTKWDLCLHQMRFIYI